MSDSAKKASTKGAAATIAIVLVTSLFFVWGPGHEPGQLAERPDRQLP